MRLAAIFVLFFALLSSACGAWRSHRLPLDAYKARDTFAPLAMAAGEAGLQAIEHPDSINVKYDDATWIQFMIQNEQYNMVILVDDGKVAPSDLEQRFTDAKAKGDELWEKALATLGKTNAAMSGTAASTGNVSVTVNVSGSAPAFTGTCQKLFDCYGKLSTDLCQGSDSGCQASFEVKIEGDDQDGCRAALDAVPMVVEPLKMAKPGYAVPAVCK